MHIRQSLLVFAVFYFFSNASLSTNDKEFQEISADIRNPCHEVAPEFLTPEDFLRYSTEAEKGNFESQEIILYDLIKKNSTRGIGFSRSTNVIRWNPVNKTGAWYYLVTCLYTRLEWPLDFLEDLNMKAGENENDSMAQLTLGCLYHKACGVVRDDSKAFILFKKSAQQGNDIGQACLGDMYLRGKGTSKDEIIASEWFQKAAAQGNINALNNLGVLFLNGPASLRNQQKGLECLEKAAAQGSPEAKRNLARINDTGKTFGENKKTLPPRVPEMADQKDMNSSMKIGCLYYLGEGVKRDYKKAINYFGSAANAGHIMAQASMGYVYEMGHGVKQDYETAIYWYRKAILGGCSEARYNLALLYINGRGVKQDYRKAAHLLCKSADQGNVEASSILQSLDICSISKNSARN